MINLLPSEIKKELFLEKKKNLIIILGITMLVPLISLVLILLSVRFYILGEVSSQKNILQEAKKKYQTPDFLSFTNIIQKNNKIFARLESFYKNEIYVNRVLKIISGLKYPNNLYLTDLSLTRSYKKIEIVASGFSSSRDNLLVFQKSIEENKEIKNAYFSPESWVDPQNVKFYLTFEISK